VANGADALGLIVRPMDNLNVMSLPLVITRDDVDTIVAKLGDASVATRARRGQEVGMRPVS
jgi:adenosylmethionine-8-amino-7-oxononanoate aminotransferase